MITTIIQSAKHMYKKKKKISNHKDKYVSTPVPSIHYLTISINYNRTIIQSYFFQSLSAHSNKI